jgi:hypothetical protein
MGACSDRTSDHLNAFTTSLPAISKSEVCTQQKAAEFQWRAQSYENLPTLGMLG